MKVKKKVEQVSMFGEPLREAQERPSPKLWKDKNWQEKNEGRRSGTEEAGRRIYNFFRQQGHSMTADEVDTAMMKNDPGWPRGRALRRLCDGTLRTPPLFRKTGRKRDGESLWEPVVHYPTFGG